MEVGEQAIHPVLGRGTIVRDDGQDKVVVEFDKPIGGWANPIKVKKSFLKKISKNSMEREV